MTKEKITPVHSFDVYGVLLDQNLMGTQIVELFREVAHGDLSTEEIEKRVINYQALLAKKTWALQEKPRIVNEVYKYALSKGAIIDPSKALYNDTLQTLAGILDHRQQVVILGSQSFDTKYLPEEISSRMLGSYAGPKNNPDIFAKLVNEIGESHKLVSHSEDSLIELIAAADAGLPRKNLFYVGRDMSKLEDALKEGFSVTRTLHQDQYLGITWNDDKNEI